jgi:hypothetical protein
MGITKMRYILILGVLCLAGCQNVTGPFMPRSPQRVDDPRLSISEQEFLGRDRYGYPSESPRVAPPSGFETPRLVPFGNDR